MKTVTKEFVIKNEHGMHARPSSSFVKKANEFQSHIEVMNENGDIVNGKSIMGLMCLSALRGTKLKVMAKGEDAHAAIYALGRLFEDNFGEED